MQKWEYSTCWGWIQDRKNGLATDPNLIWQGENPVWDIVKKNGLEGWELVSVTYIDAYKILYTFKRPILEG